MSTIQMRREELGDAKDIDALLSMLREKHNGKWIAILDNGQVVAHERLVKVYRQASKDRARIVVLFQASTKNSLFSK